MVVKTYVGALLIAFGLSALVFAAVFVKGPVFYWVDPFEAGSLQTYAAIVGVCAVVLGAMSMMLGLLQRRRRG